MKRGDGSLPVHCHRDEPALSVPSPGNAVACRTEIRKQRLEPGELRRGILEGDAFVDEHGQHLVNRQAVLTDGECQPDQRDRRPIRTLANPMATGALAAVQPFLDDDGERLLRERLLELPYATVQAALQTPTTPLIADHDENAQRYGLPDQPAPDPAYRTIRHCPGGSKAPEQRGGTKSGQSVFSFLK